jgi:hypothetical protein
MVFSLKSYGFPLTWMGAETAQIAKWKPSSLQPKEGLVIEQCQFFTLRYGDILPALHEYSIMHLRLSNVSLV